MDTGDNCYQGNYTPCTNGSDYTMGRGEVLVTGGSYLRATYVFPELASPSGVRSGFVCSRNADYSMSVAHEFCEL